MARKTRPPARPNRPAAPTHEVVSFETAITMAYRHWEAGQAEQAESLCRQVLDAWPGQADVLHLLGLMAHAYGRTDEAIDHLKKACAVLGAPASYLSNLGEICRRAGRLPEAEQAARKAVEQDGGSAAIWSNLGIILQEAGSLEDSARCLRRVLALAPDFAEGHNNLGNTLRLLGRSAGAAARYRSALVLDPHYTAALVNSGNLTALLGQPDQGLSLLRHAIELHPRMADAYLGAASVEGERERWPEALAWLEALSDFAPNHPRLPLARSRILRMLGRTDEALAEADRAVAALSGDADALLARGLALQTLGRLNEACAAFAEVAGTDGPAVESGLVGQGALLTELGRLDGARAAFAEARRRFPRSAAAWYGGLELLPFEEEDRRWLERMLNGPDLVARDRATLHFVLGRGAMATGDAARAFEHFNEGNRLKRATVVHDADAADAWMAAIAQAFPAGRVAGGPPPSADPSDLPVFVVGMPRSGSSLVEQILASHPAVHGAGELYALRTSVEAIAAKAGAPYPGLIERAGPELLAEAGHQYLAQVAGLAGGARRLVDKMPTNFLYAGLIALALPGARIVHVQRDPLDCCLSNYTRLFLERNGFTYDMVELGRFHRGYERLMAHWRAVLPADRFLELRYEALVEDMEGEVRRLLDFLGLTWDPACLAFHRTERAVSTASAVQVRKPLFRDSIGRGAALAAHLGPLIAALDGGR